MLKSVSQVMRLCVCLPFKDLNHDFQFSKLSVKKLLKGQTWGNTMGGSHFTIKFTFSSGNYVRVEEEAEQDTPLPCLWESEASYTFHSTLGQTRNHSPICKPPILQDIDDLEQETTVTQTLTSLSLTPHSLGWGWKGSRTQRQSFQLRSVPSPTPQMITGQGRACYILISLKHIPFSHTTCHAHTSVSLTYFGSHK